MNNASDKGGIQIEPSLTPQTSDEPRAVQNGMSRGEYEAWMFLADKPSLDEPYTYAIKSSELAALLTKQREQARRELLDELESKTKALWYQYGEPPLIDGHEILDAIASHRQPHVEKENI